MKKIFIFIFLLFSIIFFSSCHDDGLSGIIEKSDTQITATNDRTENSTPESDEEPPSTPSGLEEMMRNNTTFRRVIEYLNRISERRRTIY